jgi:hypothetical protein
MTWASRTDRFIGNATGPATASWLALPAILLSVYGYRDIPHAYFASDDFVYLYRAYNAPLDELLFAPHGGHILIVRNLVFLLFVRLFGTEAPLYFACVLITHLFNVFLLFRLVQRLTGSPQLAAIAATVWGATKAHAGTLAWYSVYGHVLACTAVLLLLLSAERWRARPPPLVHAEWYVLALVAATSFGTGLGVVIALPVALAFWARSFGDRARFPPPLTALALILPVLWLALNWHYQDVSPLNLDRYLRASSLLEPEATLPVRILHTHAGWATLLMPLDVIGHGLMALCNVASAAATAPLWLHRSAAALLTVTAVVTAHRLPRAQRQQLIAIAILAASAYLSIALGRTQLLGGLSANHRLPFFDRYHYLPGMLLCVLLCLMVNSIQIWRGSRRVQNGVLTGVLVATAVSLTYAPRPTDQGTARIAVAAAVDDIRRQLASVPPGGSIDIPNHSVTGLQVMAHKGVFPDLAAVFVIFYPPAELQGRRVRFIDRHPTVVRAAEQGRRSRGLIIAPGSAPVEHDGSNTGQFF